MTFSPLVSTKGMSNSLFSRYPQTNRKFRRICILGPRREFICDNPILPDNRQIAESIIEHFSLLPNYRQYGSFEDQRSLPSSPSNFRIADHPIRTIT
jgi:hypothetical protein